VAGFALTAGAALRFERAGVGFAGASFGFAEIRGSLRADPRAAFRVDRPEREDWRGWAGGAVRAATGSVFSSVELTSALVELDPDDDAERWGVECEGWAGSRRGAAVGRRGTVSGCSERPGGAGMGAGPTADA
jgi:hypothetical protein